MADPNTTGTVIVAGAPLDLPGTHAAFMANMAPATHSVVVVDSKLPPSAQTPMRMVHVPVTAAGVAYHTDNTGDVMGRLPAVHGASLPGLTSKLQEAKHAVMTQVQQNVQSLIHPDLPHLIAAALTPDEKAIAIAPPLQPPPMALDGYGLDFSKIEFEFCDAHTLSAGHPTAFAMDKSKLPGQPQAPFAPYSAGTLALTDKRLIILCAKPSSSVTMNAGAAPALGPAPAMSRDNKFKPKAYSVMASANDTLHIFPIALSAFTHVSLRAAAGADAQETVTSAQEDCACLTCCCTKTWHRQPPPYPTSYTHRILQFAVQLPPWNRAAIMTVHCNPLIGLSAVQQFMTAFERVKHLQTKRSAPNHNPNANANAAEGAMGY